MPCERPGITPISDECCFSCYAEGRLPYGVPIAIVLHEVDEHIEALNNRMENCCHDDPDCHSSFHYGVGHNGRIINWVDPNNTAWSFDPMNGDQHCGTCGWSIATQEGTGVDPNLYTINIAISTGILAFDQSSHNSLAQNNYTENQYEAVVRLVGWLAETYNIVVNQNTVWRHCDELDDFPGGCCCNEENCPDCQTYSDFLEAVQACIDTSSMFLPWLCDALCDAPLQPGTPTFVLGTDASCDTCGRFQLGEVMETNFCDVMSAVLSPEGLPATPGLEVVMADCTSWLMPNLCELMSSSNIATGATIVDDSLTFLGSDCQFHALDQLSALDLCAEITAAYTVNSGLAEPGVTNLLGRDCTYYQLPLVPDFCQLLFNVTDVYDPSLNFIMLQRNNAGDACRAVLVDEDCAETDYVNAAVGIGENGPLIGKLRPSMPNRAVTTSAVVSPETEGVLYVDASSGSVIITLTPPTGCEPNMFYIKRTDIVDVNTVMISGGADTIDGQANIVLGTPGQYSANSGDGVMVYWNGSNWTVH